MKNAEKRSCQEEDAVGLDINNGRLTAAHFARTGDGLQLDRLAVGDYPPELSDRQISARIRAFWKKEKLPSRIVRTCLHSRSLVVRYFQHTNLTMDELSTVLSLEAEEALQQPADELCIDWSLNPTEATHTPVLSGTLVAVPRKTVRRHLELIKDAGLYSINVEVSSSALYNCYSFLLGKTDATPACLINLADRTADIIMCAEGGMYPRVLFSAHDGWETNCDYLLENIQNALLYYHLKIKQRPIEKVVLIGKIPDLGQFPGKLARRVSLPVDVLDICSQVGLVKEGQSCPLGCNIATGIGLALKGNGT